MRKEQEIFLKQIPALKLLFGLVSGILLQEYFSFALNQILCSLGTGIIIFIVYTLLSLKHKFYARWLSGMSVFFITTAMGAYTLYQYNFKNNPETVEKIAQAKALQLSVQEPLEEKPRTYKALSTLEKIKLNNQWQPVTGTVLIYFSKDSLPENIGMGSQIVIRKPLQVIENAGNPGEFDYKTYSRRNGIYYRLFLKHDEYEILPYKKPASLSSFVFSLRRNIIGVLEKNIASKEAAAVAKALLIGYRKDIDPDLLQAFTNTGVVHIIAISGMHLVMIFAALQFLGKPLRKRRYGKAFSAFITLCVIWLFTLLAGAVPSITRAAVMITFLIIGNIIGRKGNIFNSLAASAFLLLLTDPYDLWDVGFLLSYTAVLSIVIFREKIYKSLYFQNKIMRSIWSIVSVTVAAQILTLPLILYYFHQFPNLFILSNLFAVPLSGLILYLLAAMVLLSPIPFVAEWLGFLSEKLIIIFNGMLMYFNEIPFNIINNIHVNFLQMLLIFVFIFLVRQFLLRQKRRLLYIGFIVIALFFSIGVYEKLKHRNQQKLVVYNTSGNLILNFIDGDKSYILAKEPVEENAATDTYVIKPANFFFHTKSVDTLQSIKLFYPEIRFKNYTIFMLNEQARLPETVSVETDLVIISRNRTEAFSKLRRLFPHAQYVLANTNSLWKIQEWRKECKTLHLRCHSTALDGAFITDVN